MITLLSKYLITLYSLDIDILILVHTVVVVVQMSIFRSIASYVSALEERGVLKDR